MKYGARSELKKYEMVYAIQSPLMPLGTVGGA